MINQQFEEVASQYHTQYNFREYNVAGTIGSKIPILIYTLQIVHLNVPVDIKFEFGNHNLAHFNFDVPLANAFPGFEIAARDVFERLLSFKKSRWKVTCTNELFTSKLVNLLQLAGMDALAKREAFEPAITGTFSAEWYTVNISYSLAFNNKEESLKVVTDFCVGLIELMVGG